MPHGSRPLDISNRLKLNADKTELLWAGSRRGCPSLGDCGPTLRLGVDTVVPSNDVRVLGVILSSDLTMDKHVSNVCSAGFYRLRQLRSLQRSLDSESAATLVHAFVTSRIDYCNVLLAGGIEGYDRQVTASFECCCTSCR